jgi:hypothetical protein
MVGWPIRAPLLKGDRENDAQRNVIHDNRYMLMNMHKTRGKQISTRWDKHVRLHKYRDKNN